MSERNVGFHFRISNFQIFLIVFLVFAAMLLANGIRAFVRASKTSEAGKGHKTREFMTGIVSIVAAALIASAALYMFN